MYKTRINKKLKFADYDKSHYDYETYWEGREYENTADHIAVRDLVHHLHGKWFIDIGGAFGRLMDTYEKNFDNIILLDYSLQSLLKAKDRRGESDRKAFFVAANIYKLPFKNDSIDAGLMVRVIHHLTDAQGALQEISRVIKRSFILEFANKRHFIAVLRALLRRNMSFISDIRPYQQEYRDTSQGSKGKNQVFLNYHPKHIFSITNLIGFKIDKVLSVSNLRSPMIKRILPFKLMIAIEKMSQKPLSVARFGPSIYLLLQKQGGEERYATSIDDLFVCPECKGSLDKANNAFSCATCKITYPIIEGIYDFRRE